MSARPTDDDDRQKDGPIGLAAAAPFRLGDLDVRPATRQVLSSGGGEVLAEPRVLQVLMALVAADGAVVSRDTLVRRCWDQRFVGEDAINRAIAKARHLADLTDPPAFAIETIPRVGYRLRVGGDSGKADARVPAPAARSLLGRRGLIVGGSALVGVAGAAAVVGYRRLRPAPTSYPLVAVLPFDNLSPDPQLGYFADGLSEDILNALIRGGGIRVTSRSSSFTFRGAAKAKAAEGLKADYLLDGSVLREGSRMRVNAHLENVARRQTLWSESYDRDVGQGLLVEDDVAGRVAAALKVRFAPAARGQQVVDGLAYDLYLQGREATRSHTPEGLKKGNGMLRAAVSRAPRFAPAWLELAKNYWRSGFLEPVAEQHMGYELGRQAAQRAIELDPKNGAAHGVISELTPRFGHWMEADRGLARGLTLAPNDPDLVLWRGIFQSQTGRLRAAATTLRRAQQLDPLELYANHSLCLALIYTSAFEAAQALLARLLAIWPDQITGYWDTYALFVASRRYTDALAWIEDRQRRPRSEPKEFDVQAAALRALVSNSTAERTAAGRALLDLAADGLGYAALSLTLLAALRLLDEAAELARALYLDKGSIRINRQVQFVGNSRFPPHGEPDSMALFHPFVAPLRRSGRLNEVFDGIGLTAFWRLAGAADI